MREYFLRFPRIKYLLCEYSDNVCCQNILLEIVNSLLENKHFIGNIPPLFKNKTLLKNKTLIKNKTFIENTLFIARK
jgi:hypothetical protein